MSDDAPESGRLRRVAVIGSGAVALLAIGFGIWHFASNDEPAPKRRVVETVQLKLLPPPPPPPPPPKVEKPPEPPKPMEQPKIQENKQVEKPKERDEPPPQPLALDAKGGAGSDAFGLGSRPGGADYIGGAGGGGRGGFGGYASLIQSAIQDALKKDERLRSGRYRISLSVWLSSAGKPERVALNSTTGDRAVDERIEQALLAMPPLRDAPPREMPQPVRLRIDARPTN
jgi:protein TonB